MQLVLITGFLGAGKTTLLKNLAALYPDERVSVIVNEFGQEGMDGALLSELPVMLTEIVGGSIFCSCKLDQFEVALKTMAAHEPDRIFVEASGLSDPSNIEKILSLDAFSRIEYAGSLLVADAPRFLKVLFTVRACEAQLSASEVVLINKCDLATRTQIESVREAILKAKPTARIFETDHARVERAWLSALKPSGAQGARIQKKDIGIQKRFVAFKGLTDESLYAFLAFVAPFSHRIKGFVMTERGMMAVDCVENTIRTLPYSGEAVQGLSILAGPSLPMGKRVSEAAKKFSAIIEKVW